MVFIVLIWDIYKDRRFKLLIIVGGEVFEHVDSDVHADSRDSQEMALRTADKLLKVKKQRTYTVITRKLWNRKKTFRIKFYL